MGSDFNKTVGQKLYEARKAKGYSRAKVGELVGLHETTVKRYEDGDIKSLDIERLKAFAQVLGTAAAGLLGWVSDSDDNLELLLQISEEVQSGRRALEDAMRRVFGVEHSILSTYLFEGTSKASVLYYRALDHKCALELQRVIETVEKMNYADLENIRFLIQAYLASDENIKAIVDTALRPKVTQLRAGEEFVVQYPHFEE